MKTRLRILTDLIPAGTFSASDASPEIEVSFLAGGLSGFRAPIRAFARSLSFDYALFRYDTPGIYIFCLLKFLAPLNRCRLVTVDLFTPPAQSRTSRLRLLAIRWLLRTAHRFFVHVRDTSRYEHTLRVPRSQFHYVPY